MECEGAGLNEFVCAFSVKKVGCDKKGREGGVGRGEEGGVTYKKTTKFTGNGMRRS